MGKEQVVVVVGNRVNGRIVPVQNQPFFEIAGRPYVFGSVGDRDRHVQEWP